MKKQKCQYKQNKFVLHNKMSQDTDWKYCPYCAIRLVKK